MALIPQNIIEEVLARADIESVVGKYVSFTKRTGDNLFGLCPFHSEKTPSFSVSLSRQTFRCWGCHKGGNSIKFIMEAERLSYPEAIRFLASQYNVEIPETDRDPRQADSKKKKERVTQLLTEAARYYYHCLNGPEGREAVAYATRRGLTLKTRNNFGLGFAPDGYDHLYNHLLSKGYTNDEMACCGLFTVSKKNGKLYDLFRGRLVFPIFDVMGHIVAFGGRSMGDDMPKYVNSPDSLVYKKQDHLYALNFAKKSQEKFLMIVEGYMDTIAMHQAGFTNTVASLGTAFTDAQLRLASRYSNEIVFFFDSDKAGKNAAIRAVKMMMRYLDKMSGLNIRIKICAVPDGKDPDEYIKNNGAENFASVVRGALDVDDYLMKRAYDDNIGPDGELDLYRYQEDVTEYGSWIKDEVKREKMASVAGTNLRIRNYSTVLKAMETKRDSFLKESAESMMRQYEKDSEREVRERAEYRSSSPYDGTADDNSSYSEEGSAEASKPVSKTDEFGFPEDVVYADELEVFVRAVRLKGLLFRGVHDERDILRPGDFYGKNMKEAVKFFIGRADKENGVPYNILIDTLSHLVFNGSPAENVFMTADENLREPESDKARVDTYLMSLYQLRLKRLSYFEKIYLAKLVDASPAESEALYDKLRSITNQKEVLKAKGAIL